jgi:hypothetical protein
MSIEKKIDELIAALDRNTAALSGNAAAAAAPAQKKAPTAAPKAPETAALIALDDVKKLVTQAVQKLGKDKVAAAIESASKGAKNASTVKPEHYATLVADLTTQIANADADGA